MDTPGQVRELIATVFEALQYLFQQQDSLKKDFEMEMISDINSAAKTIANYVQTHAAIVDPPVLDESHFGKEVTATPSLQALEQLAEWLSSAEKLLSGENKAKNNTAYDSRFMEIINDLRTLSLDKLIYRLKKSYTALPANIRTSLESYYENFKFWGSLHEAKKDFTILENRAKALHEHCGDFLWLYHRLCDYRSRITLFALVNNWYSFDFQTLGAVREQLYKDYFDLDIMRCGSDEVLVDLGAFTGDTVINYVGAYGETYQKIYCYEITPNTFKVLQDNLKNLSNIVFRQKGASDKSGVLYINENNDVSANILSDEGTLAIETVAIDDDIAERVTFIKMDIEGSEQSALRGCAEHIRNERPKLAISVYHNNEDIWKIPRMIDEICPGYQFYLRYHGGDLSVTELTLLAVYQG